MTVASTRVPQEERSRLMRQRVLQATAELLVERGYAGTSTTLVSERAGVSRGAQLHHFPAKSDLVLAAIEYVWSAREAELRQALARLPAEPADRIAALVTVLAKQFSSDAFTAALELWVAARTDKALRDRVLELERKVGRATHRLTVEALGVDESRPGVRQMVQATLDLMRGLGLAGTLSDDSARRRRIVEQWIAVLTRELAP